MNYLFKSFYCLSIILLVGQSCQDNIKDKPGNGENPPNGVATYVNPVFEPVLADPTVIQSGEYFYAYGTEDNWGNEGGYKLVPIVRSKDLVNWEFVNNAFQVKPNWKSEGGIWAPDVSFVDGKYRMYYSFSTWGDPNPGIGLAIADRAEGPFVDQGKVFLSQEIGVANSIDPFFIREDERDYLFWGSFFGIYAVELGPDGKQVIGDTVRIAHNHLEAALVTKKDGAYYFFGSAGSCCEGANSSYRVLVGKSENLLGPYLDKQGNSIATGDHGELLLRGNAEAYGFAGPGHNAQLIEDDEGTEWMLYHAIPKNNPRLSNGTNRRPLMLDKITWSGGWPVVERQSPSLATQPAPIFK